MTSFKSGLHERLYAFTQMRTMDILTDTAGWLSPLPDRNQPPVSLRTVNWAPAAGLFETVSRPHGLGDSLAPDLDGSGLSFPMVIVRLLNAVTHAPNGGALNHAGASPGWHLPGAGRLLVSAIVSAGSDRRAHRLRPANLLYTQLHRLSLDFYSGRRVGEIVSRLSSDVTQMRTVLTSNITTLLSQSVSLVGALVIVVTINIHLTLFILGLVPAVVLVAAVFGSRIQKLSTSLQDQLANSTIVAEEGSAGHPRGQEFWTRTPRDGALRQRHAEGLSGVAYGWRAYHSLFATSMMFLGFGSIAAIMWYGGQEVIAGRLTLAMINGFLMYGI